MSFKAKLKVGGKELNILNVSYDLYQEVDATGRASSVTRGGKITVSVEGTSDGFFFDWACNNFERKDGSIEYVKRDTDAKSKSINFTEAYLINYKESFDATGTNPLVETFTMSARVMGNGNSEHKNEWPV